MRQSQVNPEIIEVTSIDSVYLDGMLNIFAILFPNLASAGDQRLVFEDILTNRLDTEGRIQKQIFIGLSGETVVGILQIFYYTWNDGLVAVVDLVGVLEPFRGSRLGLRLIRYARSVTENAASQWGVTAKGILGLAELDQGDSDSWADRRVRLFERLGAQVRRDLIYQYGGLSESNGDYVIWYPMSADVFEISSRALAWVLWQSGGLPFEEFVRRYSKSDNI